MSLEEERDGSETEGRVRAKEGVDEREGGLEGQPRDLVVLAGGEEGHCARRQRLPRPRPVQRTHGGVGSLLLVGRRHRVLAQRQIRQGLEVELQMCLVGQLQLWRPQPHECCCPQPSRT